MISKWINKISKFHDVYDNTKWMIFGDGMGDFEECEDSASVECCLDYIKYCEEQIKLTKEYLGIENE